MQTAVMPVAIAVGATAIAFMALRFDLEPLPGAAPTLSRSFGRCGVIAEGRGRHRLENTVASNERVKQRRSDMHEDEGEEGKRQIIVRVPEQRMYVVAGREDRR